jgi:hypothetical protein
MGNGANGLDTLFFAKTGSEFGRIGAAEVLVDLLGAGAPLTYRGDAAATLAHPSGQPPTSKRRLLLIQYGNG